MYGLPQRAIGHIGMDQFNERKLGINTTIQNGCFRRSTELHTTHGPVQKVEQQEFTGTGWRISHEELAIDLVVGRLLDGKHHVGHLHHAGCGSGNAKASGGCGRQAARRTIVSVTAVTRSRAFAAVILRHLIVVVAWLLMDV